MKRRDTLTLADLDDMRVRAAVVRAKNAREKLASYDKYTREQMRIAVHRLRLSRYTLREIASVLGVSFQMVYRLRPEADRP